VPEDWEVLLGKWRKFNRTKYFPQEWYRSRAAALKKAKWWRNRGWRARAVPEEVNGRRLWVVYIA